MATPRPIFARSLRRPIGFVLAGAVAVGFTLPNGSDVVPEGNDPITGIDDALPLSDRANHLAHDLSTYRDFLMSGGPPPDGIPAIDEPHFIEADAAGLSPQDVVIGFSHGSEARAYPQNIMVYHEIVNDAVGGLNVAITYCPLTATAQGFKRGDTTLGVSGQLLNSNVVMFDRDTESLFSQITATGIRGTHEGRTLDEVNVYWTTWERWQQAHPETLVLSDRTGYMRNYNRDPYGSYNPPAGYYTEDRTIFPLLHTSDLHHAKKMVVGARSESASASFVLDELRGAEIQRTENFLAVYDPVLDTGYIYDARGTSHQVAPTGLGTYEVDGVAYGAGDLPLEPLVAVEAFFFAWHAFYPDAEQP